MRSYLKLQDTLKRGWSTNWSRPPIGLFKRADGNVLKGEKIVIAHTLRKEMLTKIHISHLEIVKCKQRPAKDVLLWSGMARDIEELVSTGDICL